MTTENVSSLLRFNRRKPVELEKELATNSALSFHVVTIETSAVVVVAVVTVAVLDAVVVVDTKIAIANVGEMREATYNAGAVEAAGM